MSETIYRKRFLLFKIFKSHVVFWLRILSISSSWVLPLIIFFLYFGLPVTLQTTWDEKIYPFLQSLQLREHQLNMKIALLNPRLVDNTPTLTEVDKRITLYFNLISLTQGLILISKIGLKNQSLLFGGCVFKSQNNTDLFCSPTYV